MMRSEMKDPILFSYESDDGLKIASELHTHVNCISYNTVEGLSRRRPGLRWQAAFGQSTEAGKSLVHDPRRKGPGY